MRTIGYGHGHRLPGGGVFHCFNDQRIGPARAELNVCVGDQHCADRIAPVGLQRVLAGVYRLGGVIGGEAVHAPAAVGLLLAQQWRQRSSVGDAPDAMGGEEPGQPGSLAHSYQHASRDRQIGRH